ncbi:MAG TPA: hypothetical protein VGP07_06975 [Polyangia bacterium]|jgi:hypothetical protein
MPQLRRLADAKLVIGIPTVPRTPSQLGRTLASIVDGIPPHLRAHVKVVVFNAAAPPASHGEVQALRDQYADLLRSGWLTVLENPGGYPPCAEDDPGRRPGEELSYLQWRRKVVLDFAHVAGHCAARGDFYLHVEDDMLATRDFLSKLIDWVDRWFAARDDWQFLTLFTTHRLADRASLPPKDFFSCCALLFRSAEAAAFAAYATRNATANELDFLLRDFTVETGKAIFVRSPSLFQHLGLFSSFQGQAHPLQTAHFQERFVDTVARSLREAWHLARTEPRSLPALLRWRTAVLFPPVVPLKKWVRGLVARRRPGG